MSGGVKIESRKGSVCGRCPEETRPWRRVEGPGTENCNDRYLNCSAMVYLRRCQGLAAHAPSSTTRDARVPEEEVRCGINARRHVPIRSSNIRSLDLEKKTYKAISIWSLCRTIVEQCAPPLISEYLFCDIIQCSKSIICGQHCRELLEKNNCVLQIGNI